jgi:mannose-6-phosphate isomerase-like protein (cupin superfamily)
VITIVNLETELAKLRMLRGRTPTTGESERRGAFAKLAEYRDGGIFTARFSGRGPWERHQSGDELVQIVDGAAMMHLMTADGPQSLSLTAGMIVIVPQGVWHHFDAPDGVTLLTATPQPTEHLEIDVADPRSVG